MLVCPDGYGVSEDICQSCQYEFSSARPTGRADYILNGKTASCGYPQTLENTVQTNTLQYITSNYSYARPAQFGPMR